MQLTNLLADPSCALPTERRSSAFPQALEATLLRFQENVAALDLSDSTSALVHQSLPKIKELCGHLLESVDASLHGQPSRARTAIEDAISSIRSELAVLVSQSLKREPLEVLYRMRTSHPGKALTRQEMFHIPYEKRDRVGAQRYSLGGVPMLYLSSSIYGCWEEMGRPELSSTWISAYRLQPDQHIKVLNFAYRPAYVARLLEEHGSKPPAPDVQEFIVAYTCAWPLIAACSFRVPDRTASFKVEYVIPQLLTSWLAENGEYTGIRYFSTHVSTNGAWQAAINYALPAVSNKSVGFSDELSKLFETTDPLSWSYAHAVKALDSYLYHGNISAVLPLGGSHGVPYEGTDFAVMEFYLSKLDYHPMT